MDRPPLSSIRVPSQVWSLVGIDFIGHLQETIRGNKYIVAISDHFSKWSEATDIPDKTSKYVADFLYIVVCKLGCMDTLISDQGREFVNGVIDYLLDILQTEHRISSAYHHETNGQHISISQEYYLLITQAFMLLRNVLHFKRCIVVVRSYQMICPLNLQN